MTEAKDLLAQIGLSEGESKTYLALLKLGSVRVHNLKEETGMHRTTLYDFLHKLMEKGLVTYVIKGNVKYFQATHPNKLLDYIQEKEDMVKSALPDLMKLASQQDKDSLQVEVFKGKEGLKSILNDILRHGKDYVGMGIDEHMFKKTFGNFMDWFFEKEKKAGFHERLLASEGATFTYVSPNVHYRYLPKNHFNPTPTLIWGDNVAILIWDPLTVIKIQNAALADSYSKYFEILWKSAKTTKKK